MSLWGNRLTPSLYPQCLLRSKENKKSPWASSIFFRIHVHRDVNRCLKFFLTLVSSSLLYMHGGVVRIALPVVPKILVQWAVDSRVDAGAFFIPSNSLGFSEISWVLAFFLSVSGTATKVPERIVVIYCYHDFMCTVHDRSIELVEVESLQCAL